MSKRLQRALIVAPVVFLAVLLFDWVSRGQLALMGLYGALGAGLLLGLATYVLDRFPEAD